jgi:hypothetical protein
VSFKLSRIKLENMMSNYAPTTVTTIKTTTVSILEDSKIMSPSLNCKMLYDNTNLLTVLAL